jgi:SAM-dependent methyltransferase
MKTFLHVGCGPQYFDSVTKIPNRPIGFDVESWHELRLDINPEVRPDVVGTMTDMSAVPSASVDAIFSSHNIEHLYPHEVPIALAEFKRVLRPDGFVVITCPDLQSVCALVAQGKLTEPAYISPAGPIAPLDILYGHRPPMSQGNLYMSHRCGFTLNVLLTTLESAGFVKSVGLCRADCFDLWAVASVSSVNENQLIKIANTHFPNEVAVTNGNSQTAYELQRAVNEVLAIALQHQNSGEIKQAAQLYCEILEIQPRHAQASHNLGVIEVNAKRIGAALPMFECAVESEPTNEQYWVSYIDALMRSGLSDAVTKMLALGQKQGLSAETAQLLAIKYGQTLA